MKIKIIILISVLFFINIHFAHTQETYKLIFTNPLHQVVGTIIEADNDDIIFPILTANPLETKIIKINKYGSITDSVIVNQVPSALYSSIKDSDTSFCIAGVKYNNINDSFWLRKYDMDFNLLKEICLVVEGKLRFANFITMIKNNKGNIVLTFITYKSDFDAKTYIYELNPDCEILKFKTFTNHSFADYTCAIVQKNEYYFFFVSGWLYNKVSLCLVHKLDTSFNLLNVYNPPPMSIEDLNNAKWLNDSIFLLSGKYFNWTTHFDETKVVKTKIDTALYQIKYTNLKDNDSSLCIASYKNLDFIDVNNIFVGSWMYKKLPWYYEHVNTRIVLTKIDSALNIIWQKKYGGDGHYMLDGIKATQDGGCVMGGTYYGHTQTDEKDPFIMKVDGNGNISWVHNLPDDFIKLTVYPNPGNKQMTVNNPPLHTKILLYDISGKPQKEQELDVNNTVNTEDLKAGIYFYQVTDDKGKVVAKGKWVKSN